MRQRQLIPTWFVLAALVALFANALAVVTSRTTGMLMGGVSEFALAVRDHDLALVPYFNGIAFTVPTLIVFWYLAPIIKHFRCDPTQAASALVQRRVISAPLFLTAMGLIPWLVGCVFFPAVTLVHFGRWSSELVSRQVLSPLVSGFLAATTTYLLVDWLFRRRVIPEVFPSGHVAEVPGTMALGVRARLLVFLMAVAFTPLFTVLGLVQAAADRVSAGYSVETVVPTLARASQVTFVLYVLLGVLLTLVLARTLTKPLGEVAAALRRVQSGDLDARVHVTSSDEVGILEDGVNAMVTALREKEHILQTFGRVVEPSVRDRLLAGELQLGGELRVASILFCDLRGFTALAEHAPPGDVVATLNQFFGVMTTWVRECGGFVDKFIGDAVLVVFGLFDNDGASGHGDSAAAAVRCGVGMRERLADLNVLRTAAGQPALAVAVSIHTGEVVAGRIGAEDRHEYTVIGDTVNVAARLQQFAKEHGRDLLLSETTYEMARTRGYAPPVTMQDSVNLRGRSEPVRVFCVT